MENEEGFIYEEKILQCNAVRGEVINALIAEKYPSGAEQAIHRKGILNTKDVEFASYVDFVGKTKKMVDEAINYDKQTTRWKQDLPDNGGATAPVNPLKLNNGFNIVDEEKGYVLADLKLTATEKKKFIVEPLNEQQ